VKRNFFISIPSFLPFSSLSSQVSPQEGRPPYPTATPPEPKPVNMLSVREGAFMHANP